MNRLKHWLKVLLLLALEVFLHELLVLLLQVLVLCHIGRDLSIQRLVLLLQLHNMQVSHINFFLHDLGLLSEQTNGIFKFLAIAVPVFVVFHIFECREIQGWYTHLSYGLFTASVAHTLVAETKVPLEVSLLYIEVIG